MERELNSALSSVKQTWLWQGKTMGMFTTKWRETWKREENPPKTAEPCQHCISRSFISPSTRGWSESSLGCQSWGGGPSYHSPSILDLVSQSLSCLPALNSSGELYLVMAGGWAPFLVLWTDKAGRAQSHSGHFLMSCFALRGCAISQSGEKGRVLPSSLKKCLCIVHSLGRPAGSGSSWCLEEIWLKSYDVKTWNFMTADSWRALRQGK